MLLDDHLRNSQPVLTDEDLDSQLSQVTRARPDPIQPPAPSRSSGTAAGPNSHDKGGIDLLSRAFAQVAEQDDRRETIDTAIKTASHGVKVLAPLLTALTRWVNPESEPEKLEEVMAKTLGRVSRDALRVVSAFGVDAQDSPAWLTSQVSGQIMEVLVSAIERDNGLVLDDKNSSYLSPMLNLANQAEGIATSFYAGPQDSRWQLINALTLASAEVMTEYQVFTYFHADPLAISQQITDHLNERVVEGTLEAMNSRFSLNDQERGYLGNSLLRQAGRLLAEAWSRNGAKTLESVRELPKDARREVLLDGYPLDVIFEDFETMYQGLEISAISAIRSLAPSRENSLPRKEHGTRMG